LVTFYLLSSIILTKTIMLGNRKTGMIETRRRRGTR
jgi:hypothetical protein